MTRSSGRAAPPAAPDGAGGYAGAAAPDIGTPRTEGGFPPALLRSLIRAHFTEGRAGLLSAVAAAVERGYRHDVVVAAVWWLVHGEQGLRLSEGRGRQLVVGLAALDRFAGLGRGRRGAGVQLLAERILADLEPEPGDVPLRALGGVAAWGWSEGRRWRRAARGAGRRRPSLGLDPRPNARRRGGWEWTE
jgi:hypothetical protein